MMVYPITQRWPVEKEGVFAVKPWKIKGESVDPVYFDSWFNPNPGRRFKQSIEEGRRVIQQTNADGYEFAFPCYVNGEEEWQPAETIDQVEGICIELSDGSISRHMIVTMPHGDEGERHVEILRIFDLRFDPGLLFSQV